MQRGFLWIVALCSQLQTGLSQDPLPGLSSQTKQCVKSKFTPMLPGGTCRTDPHFSKDQEACSSACVDDMKDAVKKADGSCCESGGEADVDKCKADVQEFAQKMELATFQLCAPKAWQCVNGKMQSIGHNGPPPAECASGPCSPGCADALLSSLDGSCCDQMIDQTEKPWCITSVKHLVDYFEKTLKEQQHCTSPSVLNLDEAASFVFEQFWRNDAKPPTSSIFTMGLVAVVSAAAGVVIGSAMQGCKRPTSPPLLA